MVVGLPVLRMAVVLAATVAARQSLVAGTAVVVELQVLPLVEQILE